MIITDTDKHIQKLKNQLKSSTKKFFVFFLLNCIVSVLGSLLFLYIEQCYDVVTPTLSPRESSFIDICNKSKILSFNHTESATNSSSSTYINEFFVDLNKLCEQDKGIEEIRCELTKSSIITWMEYVFTIQLTLGKYIHWAFPETAPPPCLGNQWKIQGGRVKVAGIPGSMPKFEEKTWISRGNNASKRGHGKID